MKNNQSTSRSIMAALLFLGVVLACGNTDETDKANKLVNEGNAAITEGKKHASDADEKKNKMLQTNVAQMAEARTLANEAIREYDQAISKAKEAAGKFDEASKLQVNDKFKDYLSLKSKEYNKRAELIETLKAIPQALIDSQNRPAFVSRANEATQKAERISKEADDLEAQADKIQTDNPTIIKKSS
jgi:uncharacterized protein Yka (UPF0111/DUF47 family)